MSSVFSLTVYTYTRGGTDARVSAATSSTLNFQARLTGSTGNIVSDGNYSVQFKIYNVATGGTAAWTETQAAVRVVNGYFSVNLASVTPFPGTIDWSQEHWLTMNVNGDGEMTGPGGSRVKLTAVPYAFRAGQADRLTNGSSSLAANDIFQTAPLSPQVINSANVGLRFNQTGAGGLVQFQADGADVFTVGRTGNVSFGGSLTVSGGGAVLGTSTQAGTLTLSDGSSNTGTLSLASLGQDTVYTLPDPGGGSAMICLSTGNCAGTGDIRDGGNTFGRTVIIGTNDNNALAFETNNLTKMTILPNGDIGIAVTNPTARLDLSAAAGTSSGTTTMSAVIATSTFTTSNGNVTINVGDYVVPTASTGQARPVTGLGALNTYNVTPAYTQSVTLETFTVYRPISNLKNNSGTSSIFAQGLTGRVGIGTTAPLSLFSVGSSSGFQVNNSGAVIANGIDNSSAGITNAGSLTGLTGNLSGAGALTLASGGGGDLTLDSASGTLVVAANDTTLQRVAAGTYNIDLSNVATTTLSLGNSGAGVSNLDLSDGGLVTAGTTRLTNAGALQNITGLTIASNGASITGGINNNSGGITNTGSITGVGTNITASAGLTIASGGSADLTLDSASNKLVIGGTDTSLQRTAAGSFTFDLNDAAATTLVINNTGAGAASLNINDGGLQIAGTQIVSNARAASGLTGISSSGTITFSSLSAGGLVKADTSGNLSLATAGTDYEGALTFNNGLTRSVNTIKFGGALTANTDVPLAGFNMAFSGTGNVLIGTTTAAGKLTIEDPSASDSISLNKTNASGNLLILKKNGAGVFTIFNNGATQINADSTAALEVRNAAGVDYFNVDTTGAIIQVGSSTSDATGLVFVLDSKTGADPTGAQAVAGAQYYNATSNKFRCYQNGAWSDCVTDRTVVKSADQSSTSTTLADVTELTWPINANTHYTLDCKVSYTSSVAGTGIKVSINGPLLPTSVTGRFDSFSGAITGTTTFFRAYDGGSNTGQVDIINQEIPGYLAANIRNGVNAGNLTLRFASENTNSVTIKAGSTCSLRQL